MERFVTYPHLDLNSLGTISVTEACQGRTDLFIQAGGIAMTWEDFVDTYLSDPVLFDWNGRAKTMEAMSCFWHAASKSGEDELPQPLYIFAPSPGISGEAIRWAACETRGVIMYLAPNLEDMVQDDVNSIVAHEFAHVLLGHRWAERQGSSVSESRHEDEPYEIEADKLVEKWGFKPAYHRSGGRQDPPQ